MNYPGHKSGIICLNSEKENLWCVNVINAQDQSEPLITSYKETDQSEPQKLGHH